MQIKIQKWGKSAAIRLPSFVLQEAHLAIGDSVTLRIADNTMILKTSERQRYRLADLLAQCDLTAPEMEEINSWNRMPATGEF